LVALQGTPSATKRQAPSDVFHLIEFFSARRHRSQMTPADGEKALRILFARRGLRTRLTTNDGGKVVEIEIRHVTGSVRDIGSDFDHCYANMDEARELGTYLIYMNDIVRLEDFDTGEVLFQA
jgi:hypothetical protein